MRRLAFVLLALPALVLVGCSDSGSSGGPGGGGSPVGTWVVDVDATMPGLEKMQKAEMAKLPEDQRKMMEGMMEGMKKQMREQMTKMEFVVKEDGTFTGTVSAQDDKPDVGKGTWKKLDDGFEFRITEDNGKPVEPGSAKADPVKMVMQGNHMRFAADPKNPEMVLLLKRR